MKYKNSALFSFVCTFMLVLCSCTVSVEKISVEEDKTLNVGETYLVEYELEPENVTDKTVSFKTSDTKVATVDSKGKITAVAPGKAEISILSANGKNSKSIATKMSVLVIQPVVSVTCNPEYQIAVGKSLNIVPVILPENASNKNLVYTSADENIAKVDDKGIVTAMSKGSTAISIASSNGIKTQTSVVVKQPVTSISLNKSNISLTVGATATLSASLAPQGADFNTEVTFSTSNKAVATVTAQGIIKAVSSGNANITATAKDVEGNLITAVCKIQVSAKATPPKTNSSGTSSASNNTSSSGLSITDIPRPKLCSGCLGTGYMMTGCPCYLCDYWDKH